MTPRDAEVVVAAALDELSIERHGVVDPAAVAHLALDAAIEAARIRGARLAIASRIRPGAPDTANLRGLAEQATRAAERANRAAHDALDVLVVALGARS